MICFGYLDSAVWSKLVVPLSYQEAYIAHAIVTIDTLDKTIMSNSGTDSPNNRGPNQWHHEFALQQYGKALVLMRNTVAMGYLNCLMSYVLIPYFESFHDNQESALAQAQSRLRLMSEWQEKIKANRQSGDHLLDSGMADDLGMIFDRLGRDVWIFSKDARPIQQHKSI